MVVSVPRTGSNLLCNILNQHPEILCHAELFHSIDIYPAYGYQYSFLKDGTDKAIQRRNANPRVFLDEVFSSSVEVKPGISSIGFKIFSKQNDQILDSLLKDQSFIKIFLKRKNVLQHYISMQVAIRTGKWIRMKGMPPDTKPPKKFTVDPKRLLCFMCRNEEFFQTVEAKAMESESQYITLYYEDIVSESIFFETIQNLLNPSQKVDSFEVKTAKSQIHSYPSIISNYDELAEALSNLILNIIAKEKSYGEILETYPEIEDWNQVLQIPGFLRKIQTGEWDI